MGKSSNKAEWFEVGRRSFCSCHDANLQTHSKYVRLFLVSKRALTQDQFLL